MCAHVCGCLHVCLFGGCRCRRAPLPPPPPPTPQGTADARAIHNSDFSEARISTHKNNCTANNEEIYRGKKHKSCLPLPLCGVSSLSHGFCNISPPFGPGLPFYFSFGHLLNGMDSLIMCCAEQIYLCSLFFLSFLKAVINIINI